MPIVEVPKPDVSLSQGDILTGVRFFATRDCWNENGGESVKAPFNLCMVLSRACAAAHKQHVVVAAVEKFGTDAPKDAVDFPRVLSFLTGIRDGRTSPDVFYLGQLPGRTGRYAARLDSLHTVQVPPPTEMKAFLQKFRIASLNIEFCRDLHVRVFNAFASLGFDDHGWLSTEDLEWLSNQGQADLVSLESELAKKQANKSSRAAEGKSSLADTEIEKEQKKVDELKAKLQPYQEELKIRRKIEALATQGQPKPESG